MRKIELQEACYTAREVAQMFKDKTGLDLHPTLVGQSAKRRGLDYIEEKEEIIDAIGKPRIVSRKRYGEGDLPAIFSDLQLVADQRAVYATSCSDLFSCS